ncbi:uncharacterized protein [Oscarella lobularis]|uniref:uncharacterized protein n=1 Tax=Oscarella lobularis TaxID=121494 RepID=UPI003313BDBE
MAKVDARKRNVVCLSAFVRLLAMGCAIVPLVLIADGLEEAFNAEDSTSGGTCAFNYDDGSCRFAVASAATVIALGALFLFLETWVLRDEDLSRDTRVAVTQFDQFFVGASCILMLSVFINSTVLWVQVLDRREGDDVVSSFVTTDDVKTKAGVSLAFSLLSSIIYAGLFLFHHLSHV